MKIKYSKKKRNTKKYKYSNELKKRKTIRGGEILPPPPIRRISISPELLAVVPEPPPRRKSISSLEQLLEQPQITRMRVSNLLNNEYKLCKEILGEKKAIYGEGKVRRAIKNNVNVLQSGKKNFSIKNIEENDYDVTLNPNDLDEIIKITSSNPLNSTRYPVTLVDKNDDCGPVQQQFGGENPPSQSLEQMQIQPIQLIEPIHQIKQNVDASTLDDDELPPPLPLQIKTNDASTSLLSSLPDDDELPPPLPLQKKINDISESQPSLTTEEQLKSCHEQNKGLSQYSEQCWWYFQNERPRLLSENETLNAENFRLKYLDYVPVEFQVKSATVIPHIPPPSLYEQIRNLKLDRDSLDPKLQFITRITRNEPHLVGSTTVNFFYKCNITPPSDEKLFDGLGTKGEKIQIPFPAVVFLRFQLSDDGKKFVPHGVYLVTSETFIEIGYPESILKGIVRIESEESYNEREKKNKPYRKR